MVGSSGLTVAERTADGRFDVSYLHLGSASVHRGDRVSSGAPLGAVGISGRRSSEAPHLHFGVREAGSHTAYRDPLDFLAPPPAGGAPDPAPAPVPVAHPATPVAEPVGPSTARSGTAPEAQPDPTHAPASPARPLPAAPALPWPTAVSAGPHAPHQRAAASRRPATITGSAKAADPAPLPALPGHFAPGAAPSDPPAAPEAAFARANRPATAARAHHDVDLGWLAACLGLIGTATALGHPDGTRRLAKRGRTRISAMLRPASRGS
jgi:hypothetical protein